MHVYWIILSISVVLAAINPQLIRQYKFSPLSGIAYTVLGATIFIFPYFLGNVLQMLSYTYGDMGLAIGHKQEIKSTFYTVLFCSVFGIEMVFRGYLFGQKLLPKGVLIGNLIQAVIFALALFAIRLPEMEIAEPLYKGFFVSQYFLFAMISGFIFLLSKSLLVSGLFTFCTMYADLHFMSHFDFGLDSFFYYTSSSVNYVFMKLLISAIFSVMLYLILKRKELRNGHFA